MFKVCSLIFVYIFLITIILIAQQKPANSTYLNESPPDSIPVLFAKGIISTDDDSHSSPAFSPFYDEIYWSVRVNGKYGNEIIKYISREKNKWSKPKTAPFSSMGNGDLYPVFSNDGKELFFTSDRKVANSKDSVNRFIWKVKKHNGAWTDPEAVGFDSLDIYGLSISSKGTLYFMAQEINNRGTRKYDIYFSRIINKKYARPEKIGYPISTEYYEDGPFISKDDRFLIFESDRPGGMGKLNLYISIKNKDGNWSEPRNLGKIINSEFEERFPYISPDGKYFFYGSNKNGKMNIYWINASAIYSIIKNMD